MTKCKVCGTANSPDSSVCAKCGNKLRVNRNQSTVKKKRIQVDRVEKPEVREEIFSKSDHAVKEVKEEPIKDLFSSGEALQKAKTGSVLEKIHEFEEVIGDRSEVVDEEPKIVPKVIKREATNDIIRAVPSKEKDKDHDIPQRVIRSVKTTGNTESVRYVERDGEKKKRLHEKKALAEKEQNEASQEAADISSEAAPVIKKADGVKKRKKRIIAKPKKEPDELSEAASETPEVSEEIIPEKEIEAAVSEHVKEAAADIPEAEVKPEDKIEEELLELTQNTEGRTELPKDEETENSAAVETEDGGETFAEDTVNADTQAQDVSEPVIKTEQTDDEPSPGKSGKDKKKLFGKAKKEPAVKSREIPEVASRLKAEKLSKQAGETAVKKKKPAAKVSEAPALETVEPENTIEAVNTDEAANTVAPDVPVKKKSTSVKRKTKKKKRRFTQEDIDANKYIAALSYLGILILIPFFIRKDSKFCKAHVKQGFAVFIWSLCISVITLAAVLGLRALILWVLGLSVIVYKIIAYIIAAVMLTLIFIPVFEGAVSAFGGMYTKVPFVGKFVSKKSKKKQQ